MGFAGVVVTDCLEMEAVVEGYGSEGGAVLSFLAGADIAMICHTFERQMGAVIKTYEAAEKGEWTLDDLKVSGDRIRQLKENFVGSWADALGSSFDESRLDVLKKQNMQLSNTAYAASVALIRGPLPTLPKDGKVLVLTPEMESLNKAIDDADGVLRTSEGQVRNTAGPSYLAFAASISRRATTSHHIVYTSREKLGASDIKDATAIIFVTRNADRSPWQIDHLRSVLQSEGDIPTVLLQSCAPYDLLNVDQEHQGQVPIPSLGCFEFTPPALEAAAAVLFGEIEARGRVPVLGGSVVA